jgi:hypothetical protein
VSRINAPMPAVNFMDDQANSAQLPITRESVEHLASDKFTLLPGG